MRATRASLRKPDNVLLFVIVSMSLLQLLLIKWSAYANREWPDSQQDCSGKVTPYPRREANSGQLTIFRQSTANLQDVAGICVLAFVGTRSSRIVSSGDIARASLRSGLFSEAEEKGYLCSFDTETGKAGNQPLGGSQKSPKLKQTGNSVRE
jgi:hypothetical protein